MYSKNPIPYIWTELLCFNKMTITRHPRHHFELYELIRKARDEIFNLAVSKLDLKQLFLSGLLGFAGCAFYEKTEGAAQVEEKELSKQNNIKTNKTQTKHT